MIKFVCLLAANAVLAFPSYAVEVRYCVPRDADFIEAALASNTVALADQFSIAWRRDADNRGILSITHNEAVHKILVVVDCNTNTYHTNVLPRHSDLYQLQFCIEWQNGICVDSETY